MGLTLRQRMVMALALICPAVNGVSSSPRHLRVKNETPVQEICPPCELLFSKLENAGTNGKLTQLVKVQERREPKSGTGLVYFWAIASFMKTCDYLQGIFGEESVCTNPTANCQQVIAKRTTVTIAPARQPPARPIECHCVKSFVDQWIAMR